MTFDEIRQAVEGRMNDNFSACPVCFDNVPFDPPDNSAWIRLSILFGESLTAEIAAQPRVRHRGLIMIQIFTPERQGTAEALTLADTVIPIYQHERDGDLVYRAASLTNLGQRNGWHQAQVSIPFVAK